MWAVQVVIQSRMQPFCCLICGFVLSFSPFPPPTPSASALRERGGAAESVDEKASGLDWSAA